MFHRENMHLTPADGVNQDIPVHNQLAPPGQPGGAAHLWKTRQTLAGGEKAVRQPCGSLGTIRYDVRIDPGDV
jgi:hypothetical protein